jgi:PAS domain S-box-containing protein
VRRFRPTKTSWRRQRALAKSRRRLEEFRPSEPQFREFLEGAPDAIVISDPEERIVFVNLEAERLFGYPRRELLGRRVAVLMPERFRSGHRGRIAAFSKAGGRRRMGDGETMCALTKDGTEFPIETNLSRLPGRQGFVCSIIRDLTVRREHQERQALLILELNHRVKNTLASVQSIVGQTLKNAESPELFAEAFTGRLLALSQSHDVLTRNDWSGARIAEIVAGQLAPYERDGETPFSLAGPDVKLTPNRAVTLGMVIGELATNAGKYGALSERGAVDVVWERLRHAGEERLRLVWTERGGPEVREPSRIGFGTRLIERSLAAGLHGAAAISYPPGGVVCELEFPLLGSEATPVP